MTTKEIEQAFDISNMLPNKVLKDDTEILKHIKHCVGISKAFTDSFMIDRKVIDDIKSEIQALPKTYPFVNHIDTYVKDADVIKIIERHCGGDTE